MITSSEIALLANLFIFSGPLLGYWIAGQNESRRDQRAFDHESVTRRESRHEDSERRLYEYQRELLERMQDSWTELVISSVAISTFQIQSLLSHGQYMDTPEELEKRVVSSRIQFNPLMERVTDDELRAELQEVSMLLTRTTIAYLGNKVVDAKAETESLRKDSLASLERVTKINEKIGVLLRDNLKHQWMTEVNG